MFQMNRLRNLTEISFEEANELLTGLSFSLRPPEGNESQQESGKSVQKSPGELELMSQMLQV